MTEQIKRLGLAPVSCAPFTGPEADAYHRTLTDAKTRYRRNWRGKLILQIEVYGDERLVAGRWRDATLADLDRGVV